MIDPSKEERRRKAAEAAFQRTLYKVQAATQAFLYSEAVDEVRNQEYQMVSRAGLPLSDRVFARAMAEVTNNQASRLMALTTIRLALLYAAVERWREADLHDDAVAALLTDQEKVAALKAHRHSVFHAHDIWQQVKSSEPFSEPALQQWIKDLVLALRAALVRWSNDLEGEAIRHVKRAGF